MRCASRSNLVEEPAALVVGLGSFVVESAREVLRCVRAREIRWSGDETGTLLCGLIKVSEVSLSEFRIFTGAAEERSMAAHDCGKSISKSSRISRRGLCT